MHSLADSRTRATLPPSPQSISVTRHAKDGSPRCKRTTEPTAARSDAEVSGGGCSGLVPSKQVTRQPPPSSSTTGNLPPPRPERIQIIPAEARLKRLKCSVLTAARLHCQVKSKWRQVMITTTYRKGQYWDPKDITGLVKRIRQWLSRKNIEMRYVWVLEYQKNGSPHYHMIVWLPLGVSIPFVDKRGWWTKGSSNRVWARSAVGYLAKYVSKGSDLVQYVRGARHHGNGGLEGETLLEQRWWKLPAWLREAVEPSDRVRRAATGTGGGYVNPGSGECFISPYEVFFQHGQIFIQLKATAL